MTIQTLLCPYIPMVEPPQIDLGIIYEGSIIEGSFQVFPAFTGEIIQVIPWLNGKVICDCFLDFHGPFFTEKSSLIWKFGVTRFKPGENWAGIKIQTDTGLAYLEISGEVRPLSKVKKVLFCESLYGTYSGKDIQQPLKFVIKELGFESNHTDNIPMDLSPFQVIVLTGNGLDIILQEEGKRRFDEFLRGRGRIIILANHFMVNSIKKANSFAMPFGLMLEDREYREVICEKTNILLNGSNTINKLFFFRPSPITVSHSSKILVNNPCQPGEALVAFSGPFGNLIIVGESLINNFLCVNWPFDNCKFFGALL